MGFATVSVHGGTVRYALTLGSESLLAGGGGTTLGADDDALAALVGAAGGDPRRRPAVRAGAGHRLRPWAERASLVVVVD